MPPILCDIVYTIYPRASDQYSSKLQTHMMTQNRQNLGILVVPFKNEGPLKMQQKLSTKNIRDKYKACIYKNNYRSS